MNKLKLALLLTLGLILGGCSSVDEKLVEEVESNLNKVTDMQMESIEIFVDENESLYRRHKNSSEIEREIVDLTEGLICVGENKKEEEFCEVYMNFVSSSHELSEIKLVNMETMHEYMAEQLTVQGEMNDYRAELQEMIREYK